MKRIGFYEFIRKASVGILPLLLLSLLNMFVEYEYSALVSTVFSFLILGIVLVYSQRKVHRLMIIPVTSTLTIYTLCLFLFRDTLATMSSFLLETILVFHFAAAILLQEKFISCIKRHIKIKRECFVSIEELFSLCSFFFCVFAIHIFFSALWGMWNQSYLYDSNVFFASGVFFFVFLFLYIYQLLYITIINYLLKKEIWLPIINSEGDVVGRTSLSLLKESEEELSIALIRIYFRYQDMLYLQLLSDEKSIKPKIDTPLQDFLKYGETFEECVQRQIDKLHVTAPLPLFKTKYQYKEADGKASFWVFLYELKVDNEAFFQNACFGKGKLWSVNQINDNLNLDYFSARLESDIYFLNDN